MRSRRGWWAVVATVLVVASLASACSGGDDGEAATPTTGPGVAVTDPGRPSGTIVEPEGTTVVPGPPPASVLPPPVTTEGAPVTATTCASLGDTLAVSDLLPRDLGSWPDERQRVVVDARRDAALYAQAAESAPSTLSGPLTVLADFATFVADATQDASDIGVARAAIDAYPAQGEVGAATSEVTRWRGTNCA
jgi:hypothetical protein